MEVEVAAADDTDPAPQVRLLGATSSEHDAGTGPGGRAEDVVVMDDRTVLLRAERFGRGPGRVYALTYDATDACGNRSIAVAEVAVPQDLGKG